MFKIKKGNKLINEFTTNFSELFVESYLLRFLNEYPEKYLLKSLNNALKICNAKIKAKIVDKLEDYGFDIIEINCYF